MIDIIKPCASVPYNVFCEYYKKALTKNQQSIEAIFISSLDTNANEVDSRAVNLKYIIDDEWIFFSNYESKKAKDFDTHNQISALFYWGSINTQIRIKAKIRRSSRKIALNHYGNRSLEKNALASSSRQSREIGSYEDVVINYKKTLENTELVARLPDNWGGYSFIPYYL